MHFVLSGKRCFFFDVLSHPSRIFNADESFFQLNPSQGNVIVPRGTKNVFEIQNGSEKEGVTVMAGFAADGSKVTPQIIFTFERVPANIRNSFPASMHLSNSKSGFINGDVFLEYICDVFYPYLVTNLITFPVELFIDGQSSHLTLDVYQKCEELNICLLKLFPNSTFLTQPADVSCFKSLKSIWKKTIEDFKKFDLTRRVEKSDFGLLMVMTFEQLKEETVVNGFRASGIYPWNFNNIDFSKCLGSEPAVNLPPSDSP